MIKKKMVYVILSAGLVTLMLAGCSPSGGTTESSDKTTGTTQEVKATAIPHNIEGRANCLGCHNTDTTNPVPADHQGRTSESCNGCHKVGSSPSSMSATAIPHTLDGRENCLGCHKEGSSGGVPANHKGRTVDVCTACHQPG